MFEGTAKGDEEAIQGESGQNTTAEPTVVRIWHSFASESKEELVFTESVEDFSIENPNIEVEITRIPYDNAEQLFSTAAQGGEAPDLIRLSSDQLGQIGDIRVDGYPLLEDLRPHLTPMERLQFNDDAISAMRYGNELLGIPASVDCLSLIYNRDAFANAGIEPPNENWTTDDLLKAADAMAVREEQNGEMVVIQSGLSIPVKVAFWWFPILHGFGGSLFDDEGNPTLNSSGAAESLDWMFALEKGDGAVVKKGTQIEGMKADFIASEAPMIIDGPWNWATYESSRVSSMRGLGLTLLPIVNETGLRMSPLVTYKGWSVSKQSNVKEEAVSLALHLSSSEVQLRFALETYTMPTHIDLFDNETIQADPVIAGFLQQALLGVTAPTTRAMGMVYTPLATAFEQVYAETSSATDALQAADSELENMLE